MGWRTRKLTKEEMRERIQDACSADEQFGNSFVDIADAWMDAVTDKLKKMKSKELKEWYDKSFKANYQPDETPEERRKRIYG